MLYYNHKRKRKESKTMKIYGMNKKLCKGMYVVYIQVQNRKYFYSVFRELEKAQKIAEKNNGKYIFID